jgi:glyoxylase-like metal-dependent hydrolase (beta-lactamase superfamily II)
MRMVNATMTAVSAFEKVSPGLWSLAFARRGVPPTMTGYVVRDGVDTIVIDPPIRGEVEPLLLKLDEIVRGRVRILVTTPFHVRQSELLWLRWRDKHDVSIFGHEYCATRLADRSAFQALVGGEMLGGGVRAHSLGQARRAEIPFELPSHRALAFGDTVLGIDGGLRIWPRERDSPEMRVRFEQRLLPALQPLAQLDVERVLVTHGAPALRDGASKLAAAFRLPPWSRP